MVNKPLAKKGLQAFIKAAHSLSTSACQNNACDLAHVLILGRKGTGMLAGPPGMGAALKVSVVGACSGMRNSVRNSVTVHSIHISKLSPESRIP